MKKNPSRSSKRLTSKRAPLAVKLEKRFASAVRGGVPPLSRQPGILREGIGLISRARAKHRLALDEQPFDRELLSLSPLFRRSRELYLSGGGEFRPALASSPRTLSSPILLTPQIEYSPIESEFFWAAGDPAQARKPEHLMQLRTFTSSLFHEQSHRILWRHLPPPPRDAAGLRRYLNFVESLVVVMDMALGDELGPAVSAVFYLGGAVYDPGTRVKELGLSRREYRNYLQAALYATFLCLEQYEPARIPDAVAAEFSSMPAELLERAVARSLRLDRGFVERTNPFWQKRHRAEVVRELSRLRGKAWAPPQDPMDNREQYLVGEEWLGLFGV